MGKRKILSTTFYTFIPIPNLRGGYFRRGLFIIVFSMWFKTIFLHKSPTPILVNIVRWMDMVNGKGERIDDGLETLSIHMYQLII